MKPNRVPKNLIPVFSQLKIRTPWLIVALVLLGNLSANGQSLDISSYDLDRRWYYYNAGCGIATDQTYLSWRGKPDWSGNYGWQYFRRAENDCWNAVYGFTDYWVEYWKDYPGLADGGRFWGYFFGDWYDEPLNPSPSYPESYAFEKCNVNHTFNRENGWDFFYRNAQTTMRLNNGGPGTVILRVGADAMLMDAEEVWWYPSPIDPSNIWIGDKNADCMGDIPISVPDANDKDVTPSIPNTSWYYFTMSPRRARNVVITRSVHPDIANPPSLVEMRFRYKYASLRLAEHWDECIPDWNGDVAPDGPKYETDAVPIYVDFEVNEASYPTFPVWGIYFFGLPQYNLIFDVNDLSALLNSGDFAILKQVATIQTTLVEPWGGVASCYVESCVVALDVADAFTYAHEWAHTQGLACTAQEHYLDDQHQGWLMYKSITGGGWKVNRRERIRLQGQ